MTAPIGPIGPIGASMGAPAIVPATENVNGPQSVTAGGEDFAAKLSEGLKYVEGMQERTNDLSVKAATGSLTDAHDYMIASAESGIATSLTVAVRNKAVEAFQEIMRMQA
ncbi:MAG TPA: flagellar hook-basal body complex protein FliE [Pilimelia sp.]|nr:flagellar hook-basal body complex protein FliE [Pilimelia sp.]